MARFHPLIGAILVSAMTPLGLAAATPAAAQTAVAPAEGIVRIQSANSFEETVAKLKADVAAKGIRFFDEIDQTALGAGADLKIGRSTLVLFGNPPLGVQFLQSNPYSGLDWPVRMLVVEQPDGEVWIAWTDFRTIAARYHIVDREQQFGMAREVAESIASAAAN